MLEFQLTEHIPYKAEFISLTKGENRSFKTLHPAIIFVKEAAVNIFYSSIGKKQIDKGEYFLLSRDFMCQIETEENQTIIMLHIPNMTAIYIHFMMPLLKEEIADFNHLFYPLKMDVTISNLLDSISYYIREKQNSNLLFGVKTYELFYFIKRCYPEESIRFFFTPILKKEYTFALFVLSNYSTVKNAEELAHLSNYTFSGFDKQFRKVFGMAPYKWMLQKKITKIYLEIATTSKPIKVIAEECGFTNSSHLGDFCRKHIGMSPVRIRKKEIG